MADAYRVKREMTYGGEAFAPGDRITKAHILQHGPAEKIGILQRTQFIDQPDFTPDRLTGRTKKDLIAYGRELEITIPSWWDKRRIIEAIEEVVGAG